MASEIYGNIDLLGLAAAKKLDLILKRDVAPEVEKILKKNIQKRIYDSYTPKPNGWVNKTTYHRRYSLLDSFVCISEGQNEITITTVADPDTPVVKGSVFTPYEEGSFLKMLGLRSKKARGIWFTGFPRPVVNFAEEEISRSSSVSRAIQRGIKREFN